MGFNGWERMLILLALAWAVDFPSPNESSIIPMWVQAIGLVLRIAVSIALVVAAVKTVSRKL